MNIGKIKRRVAERLANMEGETIESMCYELERTIKRLLEILNDTENMNIERMIQLEDELVKCEMEYRLYMDALGYNYYGIECRMEKVLGGLAK